MNQEMPGVTQQFPQPHYHVKIPSWIFIPNPNKRSLLSHVWGVTALKIIPMISLFVQIKVTS